MISADLLLRGLRPAIVLALLATGADAAGVLGRSRAEAAKAALVGEWTATVGKARLKLRFDAGDRFSLNGETGKYAVAGKRLKLDSAGGKVEYDFELNGGVLKLSGGDMPQPIEFGRRGDVKRYLKGLFRVSPGAAGKKVLRMALIIAVVVACQLVVVFLRRASRFVIFSEWGPLRLFYQEHKSRVMTIHSIVLNLLKYVVYFTALGFVLSEIGVNYTAYLASLSVIGLAVGFGSQGLVQDVVTGFFIIFEGQFDVGDMVEISGQKGVVTELGLRMTRLRSYFGEEVAIPNRNIAIVGNFAHGALHARVDVAVLNEDAAEQARPLVENAAREIARQFHGVFVGPPQDAEALSLGTGEWFVTISADIWPGQEWVVENQLAPRIREILGRECVEIPNDRVISFYHSAGKDAEQGWRPPFHGRH